MSRATASPRVPRVLLLGPYPPPWGGVQTNLVALRDFLRRRGIPCAAINLTRHRRADGDDVYFPHGPAGVLALLVRHRYEVTHLHIGGDLSTRLLLLGLACCLLPWTKVVLTFHSGGYPTSPQGRRARPRSWRGFVLRRFDRHIAVNSELATLFRRFGCAERQVRVIAPHGWSSDLAADLAAAEVPPAIARFANVHTPLLVTASGLEPEYDLPLQVDALGELRRSHRRAGLVILGSGSQEATLRRYVAGTEWAEHVLIAGDLTHPVALKIMTLASVFLRTTLYDGDAISVREALWLGVPVIASNNGMRPAGVRVVPMHDLAALVTTIEETLTLGPGTRPTVDGALAGIGEENLEATLRLYRELVS